MLCLQEEKLCLQEEMLFLQEEKLFLQGENFPLSGVCGLSLFGKLSFCAFIINFFMEFSALSSLYSKETLKNRETMAHGGPFPTKNTELNDYFDTVTPYLGTHATRLSVSAENLATLDALYDTGSVPQSELGWSQLWVVYTDEDAVNKGIRDNVKIRRKEMEDILRDIYDDIPKSALTTNDRNTLHLPERDTTPTTIQAVDFAPVISFEKVSNGIQIVRFQNPETPDSNAMPPDQDAEVQQFVGDADLDDNDVPFAHKEDTGKHLLQVDFIPEQKGKTAYYRARYKTETGKTGRWSDVVSEIIL